MTESEPWPDDYFEQAIACLYCGSSELTPAIARVQDWFFGAVPGEFPFSRCDQCRSLVLDRRPRAEQVWRAYGNYYTHDSAVGSSARISVAKRVWRDLCQSYVDVEIARCGSAVDYLKSAIVRAFPSRQKEIDVSFRFIPSPKARVLDYGCGNGDFLQRAHDIGCESVGVEADPEAAKIAEARGFMVL
ncbi:MAG: methyltransferase domain-containing protein, partial [Sphingomonadales bacterium]